MDVIEAVIRMKETYVAYWQERPDSFWFARLIQECGELGSSLIGDHVDTPEHELMQIASICLNWLEKRELEKKELV